MLQNLFALSPEVSTWPEPRTIWIYPDPSRQHDRFDESDADERTIKFIRGQFEKYQRRHGNLRIMEKTPSNVLRIPYMAKIFPESKFIYVLREPLAQISSSEIRWRRPNPALRSWAETMRRWHRMKAWRRIKETPKTQLHHYLKSAATEFFRMRVLGRKYISVWGVRYPGIYEDIKQDHVWKVIAKQWLYAARQAEEDLKKLDPNRVLSFKYEDFVAQPTEYFERMCAHCSLQVTDEQLDKVSNIVDKGRQMKWKRIEAEVIEEICEFLDEPAKHFGYDLKAMYGQIES